MKAVFFGGDFITVTKYDDEGVEWKVGGPQKMENERIEKWKKNERIEKLVGSNALGSAAFASESSAQLTIMDWHLIELEEVRLHNLSNCRDIFFLCM